MSLAQSSTPNPEIAFVEPVSSINGTCIKVMNADGSNVFDIYDASGVGTVGIRGLSWSPDGKHIAFAQKNLSHPTVFDVWTIDVTVTATSVTSTNATKIADGWAAQLNYFTVGWSPTTTVNEIAYTSLDLSPFTNGRYGRIFVQSLTTGAVTALYADTLRQLGSFAWNPDGTELAVVDRNLANQNQYRIDLINRASGARDNVLLQGDSLQITTDAMDWSRNGLNELTITAASLIGPDFSTGACTLSVSSSALPVRFDGSYGPTNISTSWSSDNSLIGYITGDSTVGTAPNYGSGLGVVKTYSPATGISRVIYQQGTKLMRNIAWRRALPSTPELALAQKSLDFGSIDAGDTSTACLTVRNAGQAGPLTFASGSLTGATDFHITSAPSSGLSSGGTAQYCISFIPSNAGRINGTLTIMSNGADSGIQTVSLTGIGLTPAIGITTTTLFNRTSIRLGDSLDQCISIQNTGTGPLKIRSVQALNDFAVDYQAVSIPQSPIPVGGSANICVRFKPTVEGGTPSTLVIQSNAILTPSVTIPLHGIGILPRLIAPTIVNFDSVALGQSSCQTIMLSNPGTDTLNIRSLYFSSGDGDFSGEAIADANRNILPGQSFGVPVCFAPLQRGTRIARLRILTNIPQTFDAPSRDTSGFAIDILGTGFPTGVLSMNASTNLDSIPISTQTCGYDTIMNNGSADYTVTSAMMSDSSEFQLRGITLPATIAAGHSAIWNLCEIPSARGLQRGLLTLQGTSDGRIQKDVLPLAVFGQLACDQVTPGTLFSSSRIPVGISDTAIVTVTNCGDITTSYSAAVQNALSDYSIIGTSNSAMTSPLGSATFQVLFTPSAHGLHSDTLRITGPNLSPQNILLDGTGLAATINGSGKAPETQVNQTSAPFDVALTNSGNVDWNSGTPVVTGPFAYAGSGPVTIAAGSTGNLSFTFTPTQSGQSTASVTFPGATPPEKPAFTLTLNGNGLTSGVANVTSADGYRLEQNFPNPFSTQTEIQFRVSNESQVRLIVTDLLGRTIEELWNGKTSGGTHSVKFIPDHLTSGIYFCELLCEKTHLVQAMLLGK